ncbi:NACHT, LRR and PYD domains-containing protein 3-like [Garra rufa]|uniref:NACHT, LRR and PYD domains-containing protein 3-like n=1 Tax=Garra rufa TaxID=137080 RepID=UPI003CCEE7E8
MTNKCDLESIIITFLKKELDKFKKILQKEDVQYFVKDFNENRCSIKEAALDLTLYFLREMKQDEAADTLEDELFFIHQLKCSLKKKYQCVLEGIAKQGDSTLLNNIYTDLYITQGCSEQVNTEHEEEYFRKRVTDEDLAREIIDHVKQSKTLFIMCHIPVFCWISATVLQNILEEKRNNDVKNNQADDASKTLEKSNTEDTPKTLTQMLNDCGLTDKSCSALATVLGSDNSLKELDMSNNNLQDSGVKLLCSGLGNMKCHLEILRLSNCRIFEEGNKALASALKSNPSHLRELNLSWNELGDSGVKNLSDLLMNPQFKLEKLDRLQNETLDPDSQTNRNHKDFTNSFLQIFQDLESIIITFLKKELDKFKKILQKEDVQYFVKDFNENRCSIKEAVLDLTLYFLREMKQDEAADTLEDELLFIHQLKCSLKKKYQCVIEGIAKQGDSTLLNNIYTDLYITQGCSEQVNTEHEVRQIEVASRRHESQEIQVECTNLFEAPEQDKQIRSVLTKGVAGIGKSVSVQKFVLDWAEGKENQDISFIFPLPFREMNLKEKEKLSLMDLITQFFPESKKLNLTRRNQKVLFILDGLDECRLPVNFKDNETCSDVSSPVSLDVLLTNLIKGNLLPSALIWITTRPAAASKIPPDCIDRLTEIRGFNDAQKEEYFRKRITDENLAKKIIDHVKQSKSLFIMCHIPVFCWISATVLQNILEEKRNNDVKNNQADDASKTLQESNTEDTPKTLTQMYTHFLRFQIQQSRRKYDGEYTPDVSWDKDAIFSLGKLAFHQLERNNVIFYDRDLEACGIDIYKASVYSGMCTQIFKEETGIVLGTMYCFVHLSIQEFIAALYAHLNIKKKSIFLFKSETMIDLLKTTVDKALESDNGHLDLFLRFLLGLSLQSNRRLLQGLLTQQNDNDKSIKEIVWYIKQKLEANLSPERSINLFYCLNELNDQTLVKDIQTHLSKGSLSSADLSPAQWSALAFVLLTSEEELEEFELQKFKKSDECLIRLSAVVKTSKRALLNDCGLTDKSCSALATVLGSDTSLKELNMSNNNLQDSGVKLLCTGLENMNCHLEILRLSNCSITEDGYKALASALRSNPSHLIELDLTGNDPGQTGVKELNHFLQDPNCQLKTLSLCECSITEKQCLIMTSALKLNPSHLRELNLSRNQITNTGVNDLCDVLKDSHCKLQRLRPEHYANITSNIVLPEERGKKPLVCCIQP